MALINGNFALAIYLGAMIGFGYSIWLLSPEGRHAYMDPFLYWLLSIVVFVAIFIFFVSGFFVLHPYQSATANILGGKYNGTYEEEGFYYTNPFNSITKLEIGMRNTQTKLMKITDKDGKPIDISVIFKWKIVDTYKALFAVENFEEYLKTQSEAISRKALKKYSYNDLSQKEDALNLIKKKLGAEMETYGIEISDCELAALSYSPEIANAMLQKQQADVIIEARQSIAEGSVKVIKSLKEALAKEKLALNENDESRMIGNLMVVMMSKETTQPVINL